ncbi:hypothetical protein PHMEG_00016418 [Phytophthora megakarya]|uniref:ATP-dependent DNA helicase n=1 Tax=Phytophthora megakarya TaxID=4795 RepID=A0A225VZ31_9STRA|nr:hypothetical protein PHMEG_00016418 [Phytophthora megakarya]
MGLDELERTIQDNTKRSAQLPNQLCVPRTAIGILDVPTRVLLLHEASGLSEEYTINQEQASNTPNTATLGETPSLTLVSREFKLNAKQHKAFTKVGTSLLKSLLIGHNPENQTLTFLGGLPGAGKSRVIGALQVLARQWGHSEAVVTAAYQGVAAQAANGQTIHKLFGWYVNSKREWKPTQQQKSRFAQVKLLILDEVSTCDVKIVGMIDASLRKLLGKPSTVFGGIHVLFVCDWLQQLPTCGGQPAFILASDVLGAKRP